MADGVHTLVPHLINPWRATMNATSLPRDRQRDYVVCLRRLVAGATLSNPSSPPNSRTFRVLLTLTRLTHVSLQLTRSGYFFSEPGVVEIRAGWELNIVSISDASQLVRNGFIHCSIPVPLASHSDDSAMTYYQSPMRHPPHNRF